MRYVMLIHVDEALYAAMDQAQKDANMAAYYAFGEQFKPYIRGGEALNDIATATTVRVRNGTTLTTDGPFAETKEQLSGYYEVECDNLDQAVDIAAHIPDAVRGSIEVRPILEYT